MTAGLQSGWRALGCGGEGPRADDAAGAEIGILGAMRRITRPNPPEMSP